MTKLIPAHKLALVQIEKDDYTIIAIEITWAGEVITISNESHPLPPEIDRLASQLFTQVRKDFGNGNHESH